MTSWVSGKDEPTDKYMLFPIGLYNEVIASTSHHIQVKPVHTIPTEEWAEEATQVLQLFVMDRDFPEGTWEHSMFVEMEESQLVGDGGGLIGSDTLSSCSITSIRWS